MLASAYPPPPRLVKLAQHLPRHGWQVRFLVPRSQAGDSRIISAEGERGWTVRATPMVPGPLFLAGRLARLHGQSVTSSNAGARHDTAPSPAGLSLGPDRWLRAALLWLSTPDDLVGWLPFAVWEAWRETRRGRVDALLASGPPFSVALAGVLAKTVTGLPLLLDFRDAWTLDPTDPLGSVGGPIRAPSLPRRKALLRRLERWSLERADRVAFTSDYTCSAYRKEHPVLQGKSLVLYNGVDATHFQLAPDLTVSNDLVYVGTLHEFQLPQALIAIAAFGQAVRDQPELRGSALWFVGQRSPRVNATLMAAIEREGVAGSVRMAGTQRHDRAMALMRGARVLLLFAGQSRFTRLSKISECLAAGRQVLALAAADSETGEHVRRAGQCVYAGETVAELAELIVRLWKRPRFQTANAFPFSPAHPYHWNAIAKGFSTALESLCADAGSGETARRLQ